MTATPGSSEIQEFYRDTNVFITGGTGFLGKMIIEKLLRSCPGIKKIYVLCRPKKGKGANERLAQQFDCVPFDLLSKTDPKFKSKIVPILGDCVQINLGINEEDMQTLVDEIDVIFHCAATVRFDEPLRTAVRTNVRGTCDLLLLARGMKRLKAFVHMSTAYSNCIREHIEEKLYEPQLDGDVLMQLVEAGDEDMLNRITPELLGKYPNTYTYTKGIAEDVVNRNSAGLPVGIMRPGIVITTLKEPYSGWCGNSHGAGQAVEGILTGLLHSFQIDTNKITNMVPVDYTSNATIVAAWDIAQTWDRRRSHENFNGTQCKDINVIPVFNYTGVSERYITWGFFYRSVVKFGKDVPTIRALWVVFLVMTESKYVNIICKYLFQILPLTIDWLLYCTGKIPSQMKKYKKFHKMYNLYAFVFTHQWLFENDNTQTLYHKMNDTDKGLFNFDLTTVNWEDLMNIFVTGVRVHVLKDPLTTVLQAKQKYRLLQFANLILMIFLSFAWYKTLVVIFNLIV